MADQAELTAEALRGLTMANVTPEAALNAIRMSEQILAQHRAQPLQDLAAKAKVAELGDLANAVRSLLPLFTRDQDRALFENAANVLGDFERLVTSATEANIKLAGLA
ncbi:MAG: hypothetical protein WA840_01070 [Caulobacteraceae bacterium]